MAKKKAAVVGARGTTGRNVVRALEQGIDRIITASTGNAGVALAGMAAADFIATLSYPELRFNRITDQRRDIA